jgi:hypothetical protein
MNQSAPRTFWIMAIGADSSFCRTATTPDAIYRCTSGRFPSRTRPWVYDCIPPFCDDRYSFGD